MCVQAVNRLKALYGNTDTADELDIFTGGILCLAGLLCVCSGYGNTDTADELDIFTAVLSWFVVCVFRL